MTPQAFDEQMAFLVSNGYRTVRVSDVAEHLLSGAPLPEKPIVLTFDDDYADNYKAAFPILKKYGMTATFYVIAQFAEDQRPGYATWDQLREMANAGMEISSHSIDHSDLRGRSIAFLTNQIAGSKQIIESRLGITVKTFSYPSGKYDAKTIAVLRTNGYLGAVTEIQGLQQTTDDVFEMRRVRIRGSYSVTDYAFWLNWFTNSGR
ncbi:MAG: polysaccharide deacetylase family protein [Chloroflexi bacterium]|nr:polysaccharide deacetylase family protein [Chloroflexota bacterium]